MRRDYTTEEIERGLTQLALCAGNSREASKRLKDMGHKLPHQTLDRWARQTHRERYHEVRERQAPKIAARIANEAEDFFFVLQELERKTAEAYAEKLGEMKPGEFAGALRNLTTSKALQIDKIASPLRGRPAVTIRHELDATGLVRKLSSTGLVEIEGTATEITDAPALPAGTATEVEAGD